MFAELVPLLNYLLFGSLKVTYKLFGKYYHPIQSSCQAVTTIEREEMLKQKVNRFLDLVVPNLCDIEVLPFNGVSYKLVRRKSPVFIE